MNKRSSVQLSRLAAGLIFLVVGLGASGGVSFASESGHALNAGLREALLDLESVPGSNHGALVLADRPVLVAFFASWCPPCRDEFRNLNTIHREFADQGLQIVAINVFEQWDDNDGPRMAQFLASTRPAFTLLTGTDDIISRFGGVDRIPTVFGYTASGQRVYQFVHARGATKTNAPVDELRQAARRLLEP